MAKAILLLSGGLDSTLAGKLLLQMGIEVEAVNFFSPFCNCTPKSAGCSAAKSAADQLGIPVRAFACGQDYLEAMKRPRFGRGKNMNACLDCRIHLFSRAREYMLECNADFIATGEVLGERPMSQHRRAMEIIARESGLADHIVRPLCAQLMPPSQPEREGLVDREQLLAIQGRRRLPQIALAKELGIKDYLCPAGGCLLTDKEFAARFKELLEHDPGFGLNDAKLLRYGRHFRLPGGTKAVVGRNEEENLVLERAAQTADLLLVPLNVPGPSVLCRGESAEQEVAPAAGLLAAYMTKPGPVYDMEVRHGNGERINITKAHSLGKNRAAQWRICAAQAGRKIQEMQSEFCQRSEMQGN